MKKKKKSSPFGVIFGLVILTLGILSNIEETETSARGIFSLLLGVVTVVALIAWVKKAVEKGKKISEKMPEQMKRAKDSVRGAAQAQNMMPAPSLRIEQTLSQADPYCVVCDQTGEDHFARDRAMRIEQLDDWLRNGLIDRTEYRALKEKFERN